MMGDLSSIFCVLSLFDFILGFSVRKGIIVSKLFDTIEIVWAGAGEFTGKGRLDFLSKKWLKEVENEVA